MKKAVLIASANDFGGNLNVARFTSLLAPPLGILALGSYLVAQDIPVELVDVQMDFGFGLTQAAERIVAQRVTQHLVEQANSIAWLGISQLSNSCSGLALAQEIRAALPNMPIIFGGYFPSSTYQTLLREYPFITAIVRGDGEAAALEISHSLAQARPFLSDQTPGLAWLDGNTVRTTPIQPTAPDDLPTLDFRLLCNPSSYQIVDLMTSRGCPFRCNYCLENTMRPYAAHSPAWVNQQLTHLEAELPNERVFIYDPIFGLGQERTIELCRVMREHRFTYAVESRVDVLKPDQIPALREAGIETIFLGIESASPATLLRMNKVRSTTKAKDYTRNAIDVLRACFESDITPVMGFMLGFPGDTEADYQTTLGFAKQVSQIHSQVTSRTGIETGLVPFSFYTKIYSGSALAEQVEQDFSEAVLRSEPFVGERTVLSPTPGVELNLTQRYQAEVAQQGIYTPLALERLCHYFSFSMENFVAAHPELTDNQGVTILGDSLRRFLQEFNIASTLMYYNKSKC